MSAEGMKFIAGVPSLEELNLRNEEISEEKMKILSNSSFKNTLSKIDLCKKFVNRRWQYD